MISRISIIDFAIIENIDIRLFNGLNIFTGETGSGKSIIIEAISVALGARADITLIRTGKEKAKIQILIEDGAEDYIITREIFINGKSTCKINDEFVTLSHLNLFCKGLQTFMVNMIINPFSIQIAILIWLIHTLRILLFH